MPATPTKPPATVKPDQKPPKAAAPAAAPAAPAAPAAAAPAPGGTITLPPDMDLGMLMKIFELIGYILKLIGNVPKPPVTTTPDDERDPDDDNIPPPTDLPIRRPASLNVKIFKAQYNRDRHPDKYTESNPMGLFPQAYLRQVEAGTHAINYGSKVWFDCTPRDAAGAELFPHDVQRAEMDFRTTWHLRYNGESGICKGNGTESPETHEPSGIGIGWTAWKSSLGFVLPTKIFGEGDIEVWCEVAGLQSNHLNFRSS